MLEKLKNQILTKKDEEIEKALNDKICFSLFELVSLTMTSFVLWMIILVFIASSSKSYFTLLIILTLLTPIILIKWLNFNVGAKEKEILKNGYTFYEDVVRMINFKNIIKYELDTSFYWIYMDMTQKLFEKDGLIIYKDSNLAYNLNEDNKISLDIIDYDVYITVPQDILFDISIKGKFKEIVLKANYNFKKREKVYLIENLENLLKSNEVLYIETPYQKIEIPKEVREEL